MTLTFGSVDLIKQIAFPVVGGLYPICSRPELNKKAEEGRIHSLCRTVFELGHRSSLPSLDSNLDLSLSYTIGSLASLLANCTCWDFSAFIIA